MRRTKIVAPLGPASDHHGVLEKIIAAGVDVVRLNLSHGAPEDHRRRMQAARVAAGAQGRDIGVLMDPAGPKIRVEGFRFSEVHLEKSAGFVLDMSLDSEVGTERTVGDKLQVAAARNGKALEYSQTPDISKTVGVRSCKIDIKSVQAEGSWNHPNG